MVILQADSFDMADSVTVCAFMTDPTYNPVRSPDIIAQKLNLLETKTIITSGRQLHLRGDAGLQ